jgi:hypothetical protein
LRRKQNTFEEDKFVNEQQKREIEEHNIIHTGETSS